MLPRSTRQQVFAIASFLFLLIAPIAAALVYASDACSQLIRAATNESKTATVGYAAVSACLPWRADLWEEAAHEALKEKQFPAAISYLEAVRKQAALRGVSEALSLHGMTDLAEAYQMVGNYPAAIKTLSLIADRTGLDMEQARAISQLYLALGDFQGAAALWQRLSSEQPDNGAALYQTGLLLATQNPEKALPILEKAASLDPSHNTEVASLRQAIMGARLVDNPAYALLQSGRALANLQRWDLAAEAFRQAILNQPDYAEAWAFSGEARQHLPAIQNGEAGTADTKNQGLLELQTALELDPQSLSAQVFMALYWMRQGDYNQALGSIRQAIELSPGNPALTAEMAGIQAASGDLYGAYDSYLNAAALSPYEPEYQRLIIRFSIEYNFNVDEVALPLARQLLSGETQDPIDLDLMAQVLILQGDLANAERFLAKAISANPRFASAHLHLGVVYLLQGNKSAAARELQLTSDLDPGGSVGLQAQRLLSGGVP